MIVPICIIHLLIGSTCNISGLMTECLKIMENWKMYKNRVIGFCKIRGNFFLVHRLVILLVYDYSFWSYIQNFLYNLDCDYSMVIHPKFIYIICFCFSEKKKMAQNLGLSGRLGRQAEQYSKSLHLRPAKSKIEAIWFKNVRWGEKGSISKLGEWWKRRKSSCGW